MSDVAILTPGQEALVWAIIAGIALWPLLVAWLVSRWRRRGAVWLSAVVAYFVVAPLGWFAVEHGIVAVVEAVWIWIGASTLMALALGFGKKGSPSSQGAPQ